MATAHRHDEIEINLPVGGTVTYRFGGDQIVLEPDRLAVFWAGRVHRLLGGTAARMAWLSIPVSTWLGWRLPDGIGAQVLAGRVATARRDPADAARLSGWIADLRHGGIAARAARLEIQARLLRVAEEDLPAPRLDGLAGVERAARLIVARFAEPLPLAMVADVAGLHPHHLTRAFRAAFGTSVHAYQTGLRLAEAERLLAEGIASTAAGLAAGFGSTSAFYAAFKAAHNMPPSVWAESAAPTT
ncbi:MAG TPA: hypothetical protein DCS97_14795 [Planctomycetes bacterium]|nr:hypothetical protein [Planctomycetota bacterium]